jgi:hypothetical protein
MSGPSQVTESDEESNSHGPFSDPYASTYEFTATSWEVRKNLTERFNQHVVDEQADTLAERNDRMGKTLEPQPKSATATEKIERYEQKQNPLRSTASVAAMGKPPRQPAYQQLAGPPKQEKRCFSVYLRVRPPKPGMVNTIEIVPDVPPTKIRTHAPAKSNAARPPCCRNHPRLFVCSISKKSLDQNNKIKTYIRGL